MRRLTSNPWIVCICAAGFFFFQYIQITSFNALKPELMLSFDASSSALSLIGAFYFYGTILFLIPAGILLDYLSTRLIILLAMALSLIGLYIFYTTESLYMAAIGRFLIGVSGGPFCFLGTMRLASRWFPENRLAFVTGVIVAIAMIGGIIAQAPFIYLIEAVGWRNAMQLNLYLGVAITALIYLFVYDYPPGKEAEYLKQIAYFREIGFVNGLKKVLFKPQNWYCGIFASLLNLPLLIFGAFIGIVYLTQNFELATEQAAIVCSLLFLGMFSGAPIFGYISDKMRLRKIPMIAGLLLCFIATLIVIQSGSLSFVALSVLFYLIGFGVSSHILVYPTITESNSNSLTGSALSLASVLIMSGGAIFIPLCGMLLELNWDGLSVDGLAIYSDFNFKLALWVMPICMLIATSIIVFIHETYCKVKES